MTIFCFPSTPSPFHQARLLSGFSTGSFFGVVQLLTASDSPNTGRSRQRPVIWRTVFMPWEAACCVPMIQFKSVKGDKLSFRRTSPVCRCYWPAL